jgi:hypothetical protein
MRERHQRDILARSKPQAALPRRHAAAEAWPHSPAPPGWLAQARCGWRRPALRMLDALLAD